jgi:transposase
MSSPELPCAPDADDYASYTLDHHGLVAGMVDELGLVGRIDAMIPQDLDQRHVSIGMAVKAMILIGLGFVQRALYLTPDFFNGKPLERLLGPGITAEMLNDDVMGRALDAIFAFGVEPFYYLLASSVVKQLGLSCAGGQLDSTSLHVDGEYNSGDESAAEGVVHLRKGYSRDHRPDLNQVVLQHINENQAGIPLLMAASSGNVNDQAGFLDLIKRHKGQLQADGLQYLVADSALYTGKSLRELGEMTWVSRVPETFGSACEIVQAVAGDLADSGEEVAWRTLCVIEVGIRQRWLVVHSRAARCRAGKTLKKRHLKQGEAELKAFDRLRRQAFACEADAQAALDSFTKGLKLTLIREGRIVEQAPHPAKKRRLAGSQEPGPVRYAVDGQLASRVDVHARQLLQKSCFVVATNDTKGTVLSDEQVLEAYCKDQQKVERGFRFLKDPLFLASTLFLKSAKRIMALMAIMTLCLMVYAAIEHRIRQSLAQQSQTFPDQKGKPTERPTARWVFQSFIDIHILVLPSLVEVVSNLKAHHRALLALLGERYVAIYSNSG